jgi:hypothetical protein
VRRIVVDGLGGHRTDQADFIRHRAELREKLAEFHAVLAEFLEFKLRPETLQSLSLKLGDLFPLGHGFRHRFAIEFAQLRLGIESFQVRGTAGHCQPNDPFRLGRKMGRMN